VTSASASRRPDDWIQALESYAGGFRAARRPSWRAQTARRIMLERFSQKIIAAQTRRGVSWAGLRPRGSTKLGLFIPSMGSGGAERVMAGMANHWGKKDADVTLVKMDRCALVLRRRPPAFRVHLRRRALLAVGDPIDRVFGHAAADPTPARPLIRRREIRRDHQLPRCAQHHGHRRGARARHGGDRRRSAPILGSAPASRQPGRRSAASPIRWPTAVVVQTERGPGPTSHR